MPGTGSQTCSAPIILPSPRPSESSARAAIDTPGNTCDWFLETLDAYLGDRLGPDESDALAAHLGTCSVCQTHLDGLSAPSRPDWGALDEAIAAELQRPASTWLDREVVLKRRTAGVYVAALAACIAWALAAHDVQPGVAVVPPDTSHTPLVPSASPAVIQPPATQPAADEDERRKSFRGSF